MQTIHVATGKPYDVIIGTRLLEASGEQIRSVCGGTKAMVVSDTNVGPLYAQIVVESLRAAGYDADTFWFEAGEEHKRAEAYLAILEALAAHEMSRSDVVVALGGGVVGDVAGFAAATYMRGCTLVQMPTSLLAMVDSSVGGKTAIDLAGGKNLAGAFWQPSLVLADIGCLATLTPEQFADGCGEVIKHGVIADPELFSYLEETPLTYDLLMTYPTAVEPIIARNVQIKRNVVQMDERETSARKLLNFGHSIGHAIEACDNYQTGHGTCVAMGMSLIAHAAAGRGVCNPKVPTRIEELCKLHGLATRCTHEADELYQVALHDKKRSGSAIDLVIPAEIGACSIVPTDLDDFHAIIAEGIAAQRGEGK